MKRVIATEHLRSADLQELQRAVTAMIEAAKAVERKPGETLLENADGFHPFYMELVEDKMSDGEIDFHVRLLFVGDR